MTDYALIVLVLFGGVATGYLARADLHRQPPASPREFAAAAVLTGITAFASFVYAQDALDVGFAAGWTLITLVHVHCWRRRATERRGRRG